MEQVLTTDDLLELEAVTQYPVTDYLASVQFFLQRDVQNIMGFYNGSLTTLNRTSNNNLTILTSQTQDLFNTINLNRSSLKNYKWWILVDTLEQIDTLLQKLNSASRWLRSSVLNSSFNANPLVSIKFNQGQTLESVSRDTLGSEDWDNTWSNLALQNDLREEDYTSQAGFLLQANFNFNINNAKINSIVDNPVDDKVLGIDLQAKIEFDTTEEDLVVLSPQDTFLQTVETQINLRQKDNPEFPVQGINPGLVVGSNLNSLSYPALFRQLTALFAGDDTVKTFTLVDIKQKADGVFINFEVESRLGGVEQVSLSI